MPTGALKQLIQNRYTILSAILLAVMVVYSQTMTVPWYFDDIPVIVDNSSLRDLGARMAGFFGPRGPVDLTFALNFRLQGIQVGGYHLVNLALHLANGLLLYLLLKRIFQDNPLQQYAVLVIFLLHPVQTQAVNYVVQRYTLAAAFCGLTSLCLIARWADEYGPSLRSPRAVLVYLAALFFGGLAVLCKQNMATLCLVVPLFCLVFIGKGWTRRELAFYLVLPFAAVPLWEGVRQVVLPMLSGASLTDVSGLFISSDTPAQVSPLLYFATQWQVVWLYLRLLVLPYGQALDYGYPLAAEVVTFGNLAALAGLCALLSIAWFARKCSPRTSFGIAWFFIFLLVESTFIPLDPVFEHRLYLPLAGFAIVVVDSLAKIPSKKNCCYAVVLMAFLLGILSWQRNILWRSPSALLTDNVAKYPANARIYAGAANAIAAEGRLTEARDLLRQGFGRGLRHEAMYISLITILVAEGNIPEAVRISEEGLRRYPDAENILYLAGQSEDLRGNHSAAEQYFNRAIALFPWREQGYSNLGTSLEKQGRWDEAVAAYRKAVEINPLYSIGHYNLGSILYRMRRLGEAAAEFGISYRLSGSADVLSALATVMVEIGDRTAAEQSLRELDATDPARGASLRKRLQM